MFKRAVFCRVSGFIPSKGGFSKPIRAASKTSPLFPVQSSYTPADYTHFFCSDRLATTRFSPERRARKAARTGHPRYDNTRSADEYGYKSGVVQGSSGHLRVVVQPYRATVSYVRSYLPADETRERQNASVSHSYEVAPFTGSRNSPAAQRLRQHLGLDQTPARPGSGGGMGKYIFGTPSR